MNKLFECINEYARTSDWKDFALLKICLASLGIIIGLSIPRRQKSTVMSVAITSFIATYIPIMAKFFSVACPCVKNQLNDSKDQS